MPLVASSLAQALGDLQRNPPRTALEAGQRWSAAYASYAQQAISPAGGIILTLAPNQSVLAATLAAAFANPASPPPATAASWDAALTTFWLAPPVVFTAIPPAGPGVVTLVGGTGSLQGLLLSTWAQNMATRASNDQAVRNIAQAFDTFTHLVIVMHPTPGPPIVGPLT